MEKWENPELMILGVENTKTTGIDDNEDSDDCAICDCDFDEPMDEECPLDRCWCHGPVAGVEPPIAS